MLEGGDSSILPITSKTGHSVVQNRQKLFLFWAFVVKSEYILAFYKPNFRPQT